MDEQRYSEQELPDDIHNMLWDICHDRACRVCPLREMCPHDFLIEEIEAAFYQLFPDKAVTLDLSEDDIMELIENKP